MSFNGVINASGDLLRAGFTDFTNVLESGQSQRFDAPFPAITKLNSDDTQYHRWNGSSWDLINKTPFEVSEKRRSFVHRVSGHLLDQISQAFSWSVSFSYSSQTAKTFKTNSSTFQKTTPFCFPGTANKANPTVARIFGFTQKASTTLTVRVFDVTNGNEISRTTINGVNVTMAEDATLINLPSGMATFEVQVKSSDQKSVELESFEMR